MGDAVLRVRSHLQSLARENWSALEERHARNVSWLRDELAQISRSLEVKARFEHKERPVPVPFPSHEDVLDEGRAYKKQRVEKEGDGHKPQQTTGAAAATKKRKSSYRGKIRLSMRLRAKPEYVPPIQEEKKTRKRPRPSEVLLRDPGKLKVTQLRSELKKRGLRTSGLKAVLFDRLLDALEEEHMDGSDDDSGQGSDDGEQDVDDEEQNDEVEKNVSEEDTSEKQDSGLGGAVTRSGSRTARGGDAADMDDPPADEIVRESIGSHKSPSNSQRSEHASELVATSKVLPETVRRKDVVILLSDNEDEEVLIDNISPRSEDTSSLRGVETENPVERDIDKVGSSGKSSTARSELSASQRAGKGSLLTVLSSPQEENSDVVAIQDIMTTSAEPTQIRKSMQPISTNKLASPLSWKRKSILRKASSLAPTTRAQIRKVSFAPTEMVDTIVESSQTDSTQPDPSPEKPPTASDAHTLDEESNYRRSKSLSEVDAMTPTYEVPAPSPIMSAAAPLSTVTLSNETEEARKTREFHESVERQAQRLRLTTKESAQKRVEEAKAANAFWAKHDQLKKLASRTSSSDSKRSASTTPSSLFTKAARDEKSVASHTPESSPSVESDSASSVGMLGLHRKSTTRHTSPPNQAVEQAPSLGATSAPTTTFDRLFQRELKSATSELDEVRSRELERVELAKFDDRGATGITSAIEDTLRDNPKSERTTYSAAENMNRVERTMPHRLAEKPTAKSMPESVNYDAEYTGIFAQHVEKQLKQQPLLPNEVVSFTSTTEGGGNSKGDELPMMQTVASMVSRDSVISTVSSISEPSVVEAALKAGASTASSSGRRVISNLVSGLHSFTTLVGKESSQESNSTRSAPVVNALKLAEKSRLIEEKKQLEKEKRRAALKKKLDEHKKAAALKEKADRDAREKREQERLNERKKREAELARKRQQKVKEMRAGLEKKRAMLAAEKKSGTVNGAMSSKASAVPTGSTQQKHRGLASASDSSKPATKPIPKPISKPVPKPVSQQAPKLGPKVAAKPMKAQIASAKLPPKSPEVVNYEMSDNAESSDGDSSDSDTGRHGKKKVPKWAQKDHLNKILHAQFGTNAVDPSPTIFKDFVDTCDLEAIFETTDAKKKKRFARRTSSGNWLADRPTARDTALYQHDMGYNR